MAEYIPELARIALPESIFPAEGSGQSTLDELIETAKRIQDKFDEQIRTQADDDRSQLPPVDEELVAYLRNYGRFMTDEERKISEAFFFAITFQLHGNAEKQTYCQAKWDEFRRAVLTRILRDHPHEFVFNHCPKCGALARTPTAKQCC